MNHLRKFQSDVFGGKKKKKKKEAVVTIICWSRFPADNSFSCIHMASRCHSSLSATLLQSSHISQLTYAAALKEQDGYSSIKWALRGGETSQW